MYTIQSTVFSLCHFLSFLTKIDTPKKSIADRRNKMPYTADTDIQTYIAVLTEEYFEALDIKEQVAWISEHMTDKGTLRDWVENYIDDCMSLNSVLAQAIMNTVEWDQMYIWAEETLIDSIKEICYNCDRCYYTHLMFDRDCCKYVCAGCINKHDEQCLRYTEPDNNKNKTLCLVCD